jgi:hypothetical protein
MLELVLHGLLDRRHPNDDQIGPLAGWCKVN